MNTTAIVLAAGQGKRMNKSKNKQFLEVNSKPIIIYTLEAFLTNNLVDDIILVVNELEVDVMEELVKKCLGDSYRRIKFVKGGKERYDSVNNALQTLEDKCDYVLIHDGARPLVSQEEINDSINILETEKASVLGVKAKNTYKLLNKDNYIETTVEREYLYSILTPQSFRKEIIVSAYMEGFGVVEGVTDDAMMVEKTLDIPVKLIEGSYQNIKITTPDDLVTMTKIIEDKLIS